MFCCFMLCESFMMRVGCVHIVYCLDLVASFGASMCYSWFHVCSSGIQICMCVC